MHPVPCNRRKEPIIPEEANAPVDDELSSGSSPPLGLSPTNNTRAKSRQRTLHHPTFSNVVSGASRRARREAGRGQNQPNWAPRDLSILPIGAMPLMSFVHPIFGTGPTFYMPPTAPIRGLDDMLFSPLGQHILDYEPPRVFIIPAFSMFNDFTDPYDHMLHYGNTLLNRQSLSRVHDFDHCWATPWKPILTICL